MLKIETGIKFITKSVSHPFIQVNMLHKSFVICALFACAQAQICNRSARPIGEELAPQQDCDATLDQPMCTQAWAQDAYGAAAGAGGIGALRDL